MIALTLCLPPLLLALAGLDLIVTGIALVIVIRRARVLAARLAEITGEGSA
jgi:hypothetical protein